MKTLISLTFVLCLIQTAFGVSNRVIERLEELKAMGFEFVMLDNETKELISLRITSPKQFNTGVDFGIKPFNGIAFIQTIENVERGSSLIGALSSRFPLESRVGEDERHECSISILPHSIKNGYLEVSFIRDLSGDWPMLIHIPIASLINQLTAVQQAGASDAQPNP